MKRKLINTIPYTKVDFVFITDHDEIHLKGICRYDNSIHEFNTVNNEWNKEFNKLEELHCEIFRMAFYDKLKWTWKKKKFEWFVGYHWSYPNRNIQSDFIFRKPKWLFKILFKLYFKTYSI